MPGARAISGCPDADGTEADSDDAARDRPARGISGVVSGVRSNVTAESAGAAGGDGSTDSPAKRDRTLGDVVARAAGTGEAIRAISGVGGVETPADWGVSPAEGNGTDVVARRETIVSGAAVSLE